MKQIQTLTNAVRIEMVVPRCVIIPLGPTPVTAILATDLLLIGILVLVSSC